jgi:predicted dehydrogenase
MINVGVIGCGYWGPNLIRNIRNNANCNLATVVDLSQDRLEFIKGLYPDVQTSSNPEDVYANPNIHAVVIATPVNTHYMFAEKALNNGKHVFIEKPMTDNFADAEKLVLLAEAKGLKIAVGHIFQFAPPVTTMNEELRKGLLGEVNHFSSQRINLGPPKTTVDVVWDLAPHDLSILLYLLNEIPSKVVAYGNSYQWKGFIDNAHIFLSFESGKTAHVNVSWLSSKKIRMIRLFGTSGMMEYDETAPKDKVIFYDKGVDNRTGPQSNQKAQLAYGLGEVRKLDIPAGEPLALEIAAFADAITSNTPLVNDGRIGMNVVRILELAAKSMKENQ